VKLVRGVGRNIDCVASTHDGFLTTEGHLQLAFEQDEGFFEVVTMRARTAAGRHVHVDHAEAIISVFAGDGDGICISCKTNMLGCRTIPLGECKATAKIVGWKWSGLRFCIRHVISPFLGITQAGRLRLPNCCGLSCQGFVAAWRVAQKLSKAGDFSLGRFEAAIKVALEHHALAQQPRPWMG
jgi:hypothetical protein